jgi:integrase
LRSAIGYGYRDAPEKHNPATGSKCLRITKKDRPLIDPFSIQESEALIAAIHRDWGKEQGNYDEFRFFTGLGPPKKITLLVSDCDVVHGKISFSKARVMARDKDRTKISTDRPVELCPRALQQLKRHLALRALATGRQDPARGSLLQGGRRADPQPPVSVRALAHTLRRMKTRYRDAYNARHSTVSWNQIVGKNPLWVAKMHGHSVQTMLDTYAAWTEGAQESDVEAIRVAMGGAPERVRQSVPVTVSAQGPKTAQTSPLKPENLAGEWQQPPGRA